MTFCFVSGVKTLCCDFYGKIEKANERFNLINAMFRANWKDVHLIRVQLLKALGHTIF